MCVPVLSWLNGFTVSWFDYVDKFNDSWILSHTVVQRVCTSVILSRDGSMVLQLYDSVTNDGSMILQFCDSLSHTVDQLFSSHMVLSHMVCSSMVLQLYDSASYCDS